MSKIKHINGASVHRMVTILIGVILALVPLYATRYVFAGLMFQKAILFYGLTTLLILAYLWLIYCDKQYLPRFSLVGWAFAILTVGWIISTLTSQQPYMSFWGTFNRMEGLISWLYYFALFIVATGTLRKLTDWWMVIRITMVGVALVTLYALAQLFRINLFAMSMDRWRVEGTLGNPVFLGGYLASAIPLIVVWAFNVKSYRWAAWSLVGLTVVTFMFTLSRGAWIAGLIAILITLMFYFRRYHSAWMKRLWIYLGVGLAVFILLTISWTVAPADSTFKQVGEKAIFRSESMLYRRNNWSIGWQSFLQKPWTGWGLENFHVAFDRNYRTFKQHAGFTESHVDRPHNEYVGVAVAGGLIALVPYLLLMGYAIYRGWRRLQAKIDPDTYLINVGMLGALIGYAVFVFTAFNLITNILFLILALAWVNQSEDDNKRVAPSRPNGIILAVFGVAAVAAAYFTVIAPVQAVRLADQATLEFQRNGNYQRSLELFKRSLARGSFMSNTIRSQMSVISSSGSVMTIEDRQLTDFRKYTGSILRDIFVTEPYTSYTHMIAGLFYGNLAGALPEFIPTADEVFQSTVDIAPRKGETWLRWGEMYANLGQWNMAKPKLDRAMELDPHNYDIQFAGGVWYIWFGESERGNELVKRAIQAGHPAGFAEVQEIGNALEHAGLHDKAEVLYRQIIDKPQNEQETVYAIVQLIDVYRRAGRWDDASALLDRLSQYEVDQTELSQMAQSIEQRVAPAVPATNLGY